MASELMEALQALAHEKKIDEFYLIERLEASLARSYQNILDLEWDARVTIDRTTGRIYVYELVPVGEPDEETGEYSEFEERDVTPNDVSRIAAQNAKGVIAAMVREAGRQSIYEEFSDRVGDIVTATVLQVTPDFTIVKIRDGVEAELPHYDEKRYPNERNERPAGEHYRHNQRIKVLIIDVRDPNALEPRVRGDQARPAIVVSRTHPDLIRRLFELEVPAWSRSSLSPVSPALVPRLPWQAAKAISTLWAHASARRAAASAWSSKSSATSASTSFSGTKTPRNTLPRL